MTNRQTNHEPKHSNKAPAPSHFKEFNGYDSYCNPTDYNAGGEAVLSGRISQKRLESLAENLSKKDQNILSTLRHCRYATTKQLQHLYFTDAKTSPAGLRAANRNTNKLKKMGLLAALSRRIGGVRAGSGSFIWYLTQAGERLLRLTGGGAHASRRFFEPSPHFLAHTLAVSECFVQLKQICSGHTPKLVNVEFETDCWRPYNHKGTQTTLRPDLFATTTCEDKYEDRWFFEVDLKTEAPVTVIEKCYRYHQYYRSGLEQKLHNVFPLTVWIVPDIARKDSLTSYLRAEFAKLPKLFIIITPDELAPLIQQGIKRSSLC